MPHSNPDFDFPCHRTFWETDAEYEHRASVMTRLRERAKSLHQNLDALDVIVDSEQKFGFQCQQFMDAVYGLVQDDEMRKALALKGHIDRKYDVHRRLRDQYKEELKSVNKELSELTR